ENPRPPKTNAPRFTLPQQLFKFFAHDLPPAPLTSGRVVGLHRVRGFVARERACQIGLDLLLRLPAVLLGELHADAGGAVPLVTPAPPWVPPSGPGPPRAASRPRP